MVKKRINTTLDEYLWKQAMFKNIKWSNALEIGIKAMVGVNKEKEELIQEQQTKEAELLVISAALKKIGELEKAKKKNDEGNMIWTDE